MNDQKRAALAQQDEPDLSRCPQCNGPADNGFDRSIPPSPYLCTKCMAEPVTEDMKSAVRWAPSSAYWSQRLRELFGPDAREGIDALERRLAEAQQAEPVEPVAKVELMMTGGNAGLATRIVEIENHLRERLRPGQQLYIAPPPPQRPTEPAQGPEGVVEFLADLQRSRTKYPKNRRMFDGLMGEIDELRRAYAGDGDIRAEAFDVAVCAFRIATEGDAGGNARLQQAEPWERRVALAEQLQVQQAEPVAAVAENATTQQRVVETPPSDYRRGYWDGFNIGKREGRIEAEDAAKKAEPVEPVAWMCSSPELMAKGYSRFSSRCEGDWNIPVYTAPHQRKPLTEEVAALTAQRDALLEALRTLVRNEGLDAYSYLDKGIGTATAAGQRWLNARAAIKAVEDTK